MIEIDVARTMFGLCFAGGFAVALLVGMLMAGLIFAQHLSTLRDELEEMNEELMVLMKELNKEE